VTLFGIPNKEEFMPPDPPPIQSSDYTRSFDEVKAIGGKQSSVRTKEEGEIAIFWSDFSYTAMPPGHWHEIAADIIRHHPLSIPDTARLFALLSIAQADAAIVCWEVKYRYNTWRPITAIRRAADDGNPNTKPDAQWDHFLSSPNFPEYTSGHSTFSKASAAVLRDFFGTDKMNFSARSDTLPSEVRKFTSFSACADEVGMSRIYGGIHFQFSNIEGKACGEKIGEYVSSHLLLAVNKTPVTELKPIPVPQP
jgi:hypothetical protein